MRIIKIIAQSLLLLTSVAASAQNTVRWDGFTLGLQLGQGWNKSQYTYDNPNYYNTLGAILLGSNFSNDEDGFTGGGYAGYNFRVGPYIAGIEATYWGTDIKDEFKSPFFDTDQYESRIHSIALARVRFGYPFADRWIASLAVGWAGSDTELTLNDPIAQIKANKSVWANGWTVGGGLDYKLWMHMMLGIAYDYTETSYTDKTISCPSCPGGVGGGVPVVDGTFKTQTVTARVSYLF